jgi:hypothetical protein
MCKSCTVRYDGLVSKEMHSLTEFAVGPQNKTQKRLADIWLHSGVEGSRSLTMFPECSLKTLRNIPQQI